jgi:hypothetical protein
VADERASSADVSATEAYDQLGLQRINLKLGVELPAGSNADSISDQVLSVFGRWRLEEGEEILDLADYSHIPDGPGVVLVGHLWHFGIDWGYGRPGLYYASRRNLTGPLDQRLEQALTGLLEKSIRLLADDDMQPAPLPRCGDLQIQINDRLRHPNNAASEAEFRPAVEALVARIYGGKAEIEPETDPGERLGWRVKATTAPASLAEVRAALA